MQLSDTAKKETYDSNRAKGALCILFDRHMKTIEEWIKDDNKKLCTPAAVKLIKRHTGLSDIEIVK